MSELHRLLDAGAVSAYVWSWTTLVTAPLPAVQLILRRYSRRRTDRALTSQEPLDRTTVRVG